MGQLNAFTYDDTETPATGWTIAVPGTVQLVSKAAVNGSEFLTFGITTDFTSNAPSVLTLTQDGAASTSLHDIFNLTIKNDTSTTWLGFRIDYIDLTSPPVSTETLHPAYAHFHDTLVTGFLTPATGSFGSIVGYNTINSSPQLLGTPPSPTINGANELQLSGGTFASGTQQTWTGIGVHQFQASTSGGGSFQVVLIPLAYQYHDTISHWTITAPGGVGFVKNVNGFLTFDVNTVLSSNAPASFEIDQDGASSTGIHYVFNISVANYSGTVWKGFRIDYVDLASPPASAEMFHPTYAHFHDFTQSQITGFLDPVTAPFGSIVGYNTISNAPQVLNGLPTINGANELRLSGGTFTSGCKKHGLGSTSTNLWQARAAAAAFALF
jgi:hypothetical protein